MVFINIIFEEKRLIIALSYVRRTKSLFLVLGTSFFLFWYFAFLYYQGTKNEVYH